MAKTISCPAVSTPTQRRPGTGPLSTGLLFGGLLVLLACAVQDATGISGMPRFWYTNRMMWWLLGLGSVMAGIWTQVPHSLQVLRTNWRPSQPGLRFMEVLVYTREDCHLCEEALATLAEYQRWLPRTREIDIDADPALVEKYGTCVPVVVCDGKVRFRGRVSPTLLQRLIEGTPPRS